MRMLMQRQDRGGYGRRNIIVLFDAFRIESANAVHRCLIMELAGLDFASLVMIRNYGFDDIVYLFKQCAEAVEFLHSLGISHGGTYVPS
jgi:serine/threonine protein kinase